MKIIPYRKVAEETARLCRHAACQLPPDVRAALEAAAAAEQSGRARHILAQCLENAAIAANENLPICQDTGAAVFFVEKGAGVRIRDGSLADAITEGVARGYQTGYLRKSIVDDPLFDRKNTGDNTPPIIHLSEVSGDTLKITLAPKGAGTENMSALAMLNPGDGKEGVIRFIIRAVVDAGGKPCPPVIIGAGLGGTAETAMLLSKKALLRPAGQPHPDPRYAELESEILERINASGIGAQGLGGTVTALAAHIETFPCHIASLPVAVSLNCHAARRAEAVL